MEYEVRRSFLKKILLYFAIFNKSNVAKATGLGALPIQHSHFMENKLKKNKTKDENSDPVPLKTGSEILLPKNPYPGQIIHFYSEGIEGQEPFPVIKNNGQKIFGEDRSLIVDREQFFSLKFYKGLGWILVQV